MEINQLYLYWVPDSRKVCYLAISVSNELLCLGHFLTYWFSPLLTMIWTFCHLWQQYKHENKFIGQIFQDPAKLWSIITLELALKGYGFILKLFFKVSYIEIVTQLKWYNFWYKEFAISHYGFFLSWPEDYSRALTK